jgi:hypothetical protein
MEVMQETVLLGDSRHKIIFCSSKMAILLEADKLHTLRKNCITRKFSKHKSGITKHGTLEAANNSNTARSNES